MHQQPNPLSPTVNRTGASSSIPQESPKLLLELDRMLVRRASAIEDELREISQVRARIQGALALTANGRT